MVLQSVQGWGLMLDESRRFTPTWKVDPEVLPVQGLTRGIEPFRGGAILTLRSKTRLQEQRLPPAHPTDAFSPCVALHFWPFQ